MLIRISKKEFFYKWLEWLNPILPLAEIDRRILAALLTLHFTHKERYNEDTLQELLMSEDTKTIISKKLNIPKDLVDKSYDYFRQSGIITSDNALQRSLTNYPSNNKFKISIDFELTD